MSDNAKLVIPDLVAEGLRAIPAEVRAKLSIANIDALTRPLRTALDRERAERRAAALHEAAREAERVARVLHANDAGHEDPHRLMFDGAMQVVIALEKLAGQPDPLEAARDIVREMASQKTAAELEANEETAGGDYQDGWDYMIKRAHALRRALGMEVDEQ